MTTLAPCTRSTLYVIGVSTSQSSLMKVFATWADALGLDAEIRGYDAQLHAELEAYRRTVDQLRTDEQFAELDRAASSLRSARSGHA